MDIGVRITRNKKVKISNVEAAIEDPKGNLHVLMKEGADIVFMKGKWRGVLK